MSSAPSFLLKFLDSNGTDVFNLLLSKLDQVPTNANGHLQDHVQQIRSALTDALANSTDSTDSQEVQFNVNNIDDSFFVSSVGGKKVTDANYAFVELLGPTGAYHDDNIRLGLSYQGPWLSYLGHHHLPRELYFVLEGSSDWWTDSVPKWVTRDMSWHLSHEHHAMKTNSSPALYFWSWTGEDLALDVKHSDAELQAKL
jgi:hypothetical protein